MKPGRYQLLNQIMYERMEIEMKYTENIGEVQESNLPI